MKKRNTGRSVKHGAQALGPEDWLAAAWEALARDGEGGVKVERLAAALGVTKGSFYWHFADRSALLSALLEDWERRATALVIEQVDACSESPLERLRALVQATTGAPEAPDVEHAVRAWGAQDAQVRKRLRRVDARREAYVTALLEALGVPPGQATMRARLLYLALIGEFTWVAHGGPPTDRAAWDELLARLTSRERKGRG